MAQPEPEPEFEYVKVQGSDIYFHCEVSEDSVLELNLKVKKLAQELRHKHMDLGLDHVKPEIRIFIRSEGGDLHSGLSAMDCLVSLKSVKIRTIADGVCASAATFILLGGRTRYMTPNSYVLIHQLNMDGQWGKFEDFKDQMGNLEKFMKQISKIYLEETNVPESKLKKILKRDVYMNSKRCLKWGVVDELWK
jgi:ATP-dependent Clp endopeptidase proteolytic subunit ClpP